MAVTGRAATNNAVKRRRTSQQKHNADAETVKRQKLESQAIKLATTTIHENEKLDAKDPQRCSRNEVVRRVNAAMGTSISSKTVTRMYREGRINSSPMKRGPAGDFSKEIWKAMCGAFTTYIKLEQAHSKKQSTLNQLARKVNSMVAKAGHKKTGNDLARKLKSCTADLFSIDKLNVQELRRLQWTSFSNLSVWFDTWKQTLIYLGFAREKLPDDECDGELFFFEGQLQRITNLDETDGSMDNTNGLRGGRKPMAFYAHDISGGGNMANKTSHSSTIIYGSNAAGEAFIGRCVHLQQWYL